MKRLDGIYVIDDAVGPGYQQLLIKELYSSSSLSWYLMPDITLPPEYLAQNNITVTTPGFSHFYKDHRGILSAHYPLVAPVAHEACDRVGVEFQDITRARSFLQLPLAQRRDHNHIHVDQPYDHIVCIYYVLSSDGDLVIYDRTTDDCSQEQINLDPGRELQRVTPQQGRAVIMDGRRYHCSSAPSQSPRLNINFNLV
jgi:hypothetical protein